MSSALVFFGSSDYSVPVLQKLLDEKIKVVSIITTPDKPAGHHLKLTPNPLKKFAIDKGLKIIDNNEQFVMSTEPCLGLVAAYGRIIPQSTLDTFNNQIFNIHPSLLPKYRGPSPLQQQILDETKDTGVTLIQIDAKMDHGPIVAQGIDDILDTDTPPTLGKRLFIKGTELFIKYLSLGQLGQLRPQDDSQATYTHKLTRDDGFIPWEEYNSSLKIKNLKLRIKFRAYYPWPGLWTTDPSGTRLKIKHLL